MRCVALSCSSVIVPLPLGCYSKLLTPFSALPTFLTHSREEGILIMADVTFEQDSTQKEEKADAYDSDDESLSYDVQFEGPWSMEEVRDFERRNLL